MKITQDVRYIGVSDHDLDLFEGQYKVPDGMAYNSYVILDEKIAVFDTVDKKFGDEWLDNLKNELGGRTPDYLVVLHMEPDHSANIAKFAEVYKNAKIVSSAAAFRMVKAYFGDEFTDRRIVVKEGDKLNLGKHELTFVGAPMVHWPEVIVAYESSEKLLFSADAFGKFGAFDVKADWACEARRYYFGIVGKYGVQAQNLLKKAAALDIEKILPLHGPLLTENLGYYLGLYNTWSSYGIESEGVTIAYTSVYGHTEKAVKLLKEEIEKAGVKVAVHDLARCDESEAVEDAFRYGKLVLATTTYNASIFPFMQNFINALTERNYKNRKIGLIENGSWAPTAAKIMRAAFENSENIEFCPTTVKIVGAVSEENEEQIRSLAKEIIG
jgi:flavorubredoxin